MIYGVVVVSLLTIWRLAPWVAICSALATDRANRKTIEEARNALDQLLAKLVKAA